MMSIISMIGVAIGTMALVVVLSVINGLEENIRSLYGSFDPEIKIEASNGKSFIMTDSLTQQLNGIEGIDALTEVVEDNALVEYKEAQMIIKIKGVSDNFLRQNQIEHTIIEGDSKLKEGNVNYAILGRSIQLQLSIPMDDEFNAIKIYYPKDVKIGVLDPSKLFKKKSIMPGGVFAIEQQYTESYIFVPLNFALDLFDFGQKRTSLEVKTDEGFKVTEVKDRIASILGKDFKVLNGDEQHASLLRAIKTEKLIVFFVFSFILALASFNIFFALTMLGIEKKKDVAVLYSMGATPKLVKRIFLAEGTIIAFSGAIVGLVLGFVVCLLQQHVGLVSMGMQSSVIDAYPIKMEVTDFIFTAISIIIITFLASYRPAVMSTKVEIANNL